MQTHRLGSSGPRVSTLGLGCMGMSDVYGPADRAESIATIHAALDAGITLLDTGDFSAWAIMKCSFAKRCGAGRASKSSSASSSGPFAISTATSSASTAPVAIRNFLSYTLRRLGTDHVDIYRPARLDPNVPIEDTVGTIADLVKAGYVRHIGLSEVGAATLRRARKVHAICDLQIEYALVSRGIETEILPTCRELGIAVTAYGSWRAA